MVDDEAAIRSLLRAVLQLGGFRVLLAASIDEAEKLWQAEAANISLLVTDYTLPGGTCENLIASLRRKNPKLPVIVISGYSRDVVEIRGSIGRGVVFLEKPFKPVEFIKQVREMIRSSAR